MTGVFLCKHSFYFIIFIQQSQSQNIQGTFWHSKISSSITALLFYFLILASTLLPSITSCCQFSFFPCRQEVFYSASNSAGISLFFKCFDEESRTFADERKDNKGLKLNVPLLKSSHIGQIQLCSILIHFQLLF